MILLLASYRVLPPAHQNTYVVTSRTGIEGKELSLQHVNYVDIKKFSQQMYNQIVEEGVLNGFLCSTIPDAFWWSNQSRRERHLLTQSMFWIINLVSDDSSLVRHFNLDVQGHMEQNNTLDRASWSNHHECPYHWLIIDIMHQQLDLREASVYLR